MTDIVDDAASEFLHTGKNPEILLGRRQLVVVKYKFDVFLWIHEIFSEKIRDVVHQI
jgi:hypothetical protein